MKAALIRIFIISLLFLNFSNSLEDSLFSDDCSSDSQYRCKGGKCIPKKYVCNAVKDCPERDDENNCDIVLCEDKNRFYKCRDKITCIAKELTCDNEPDCPDASDESSELCDGHLTFEIQVIPCNTATHFECENHACIPLYKKCNGIPDCITSEDEDPKMCKNATCPGFLCDDGQCLASHSLICDGVADCADKSDEAHCTPDCKLSNSKFLCESKDQCISLDKVCDGTSDCKDKSDEGGKCNSAEKCSSLTCNNCKQLPTGPTCICDNGFSFNHLTRKCEDIDECAEFGTCSQGCVNTNGSYYCTCANMFTLNSDKKTCESQSQDAMLLYTTKGKIKELKFQGPKAFFHQLVHDANLPVGVAFDGENYYWTEVVEGREQIVKTSLTSTNKEILLSNGLEMPEDIAVDWLTKNIYFSDSQRKHIAVCTNDGLYCTAVVSRDSDSNLRSLALHPTESLMFWTDWGKNAHIAVAFMDGKQQKILVTDLIWPNGLALDLPNGRMYWVDGKMRKLETATITGKDRRVILEGLAYPYSIAVYGNKLFWSEHDTKVIKYCDKFTGRNQEILEQGSLYYDVHVFDSAMMPKKRHLCEHSQCSHICLLAANNSFTCACPDNMRLQTDGRTCFINSAAYKIVYGALKQLYITPYNTFGRQVQIINKYLNVDVDKIAYNYLNGDVFIADNSQKLITVFGEDMITHNLVTDHIQKVSSMSFDYFANNLYWSDFEKGTIEVFSLTTKKRAIVQHFTGENKPVAIALIPLKGEMFVVLQSRDHSHIDRMSISGDLVYSDHTHVIEDGLGLGNIDLAVDEENEKLYWADTGNRRIEFSNYDGSERKVFHNESRRAPFSIALIGKTIAWTSFSSSSMQMKNKNGQMPIKVAPLELGMKFWKRPSVSITSGTILRNNHICLDNNGNCSDICVSHGINDRMCACETGSTFKDLSKTSCKNRTICDFKCTSGECLEASKICDGRKDCKDGSDEVSNSCKTKICAIDEFKCDNGECIPFAQRCDKNFNCKDLSDEKSCDSKSIQRVKCKEHQIECPDSNFCIDATQLCDGKKDCLDGFDELASSCKMNCPKGFFKCISGQCIPKEFECNAMIECADGSDEHSACPNQICQAPMKPCRNGFCINEIMFCDGHPDCPDAYDEVNCGSTTSYTCDINEFQCTSENKCIPFRKKCDTRADCKQAEDEKDCFKCDRGMFQCNNNQCIDEFAVCNGVDNCGDSSDEMACGNSSTIGICSPGTYKCSDGKCLDFSKVCDDKQDCADDESPMCDEACSRLNPCDQICKKTPKGAKCECKKGYKLKGVGDKKCIDIDECAEYDPCAQICHNLEGSYKCSCYDGYVVGPDSHECRALGSPEQIFYIINDEIRKLNRRGLARVVDANITLSDLAFDVARNRIIFSMFAGDGIMSATVDTEYMNVKYLDKIPEPHLIAYDWIAQNIYTTHYFDRTVGIHLCNMETGKCVLIRDKLPNSELIASINVDPINRYVFYVTTHYYAWLRNKKTTLIRMKLDGSDVREIFNDTEITSIALDIDKKLIYFTEKESQSLQSINYEGGEKQTLVYKSFMLKNPAAMSIFENHAYIFDQAAFQMRVCKLYGDKKCTSAQYDIANAKRFLIAHKSMQKQIPNVCQNNRCEEMCTAGDLGAKCLCSNGLKSAVMCDEKNLPTHERKSSRAWLWAFLILVIISMLGSLGYLIYKKRGFHKSFNLNMHFMNRDVANEFTQDLKPASPQQTGSIVTSPPLLSTGKKYSEMINNDYALPSYESVNPDQNYSDEETNADYDRSDVTQRLIL